MDPNGLMDLFLDTNIFVASLTDEPGRGEAATQLMNQDAEFRTSRLNLMELRTVLTKKKRVEQPRVESIIRDIEDRTKVRTVTMFLMERSAAVQKETLLYPLDAIVYSVAFSISNRLVTFDSELLESDERAIMPEVALQQIEEKQ